MGVLGYGPMTSAIYEGVVVRNAYQERGRVGILLTGLTLSTFCCACPKSGSGIPTSYVVGFS